MRQLSALLAYARQSENMGGTSHHIPRSARTRSSRLEFRPLRCDAATNRQQPVPRSPGIPCVRRRRVHRRRGPRHDREPRTLRLDWERSVGKSLIEALEYFVADEIELVLRERDRYLSGDPLDFSCRIPKAAPWLERTTPMPLWPSIPRSPTRTVSAPRQRHSDTGDYPPQRALLSR